MELHAGDWVEIRTREEILSTLDKAGRLEGLPFMPEMFKYCGQKYQVYKSAHKTCDTVSGSYVGRSLPGGIHLDLRCDGAAHGGCQAGCLIFWKGAWLKPLGQTKPLSEPQIPGGCTETDVLTAAQNLTSAGQPRYVCQATELLEYTRPLKWWDARQYVDDLRTKNVSLGRMASVFAYFACYYGSFANRRTLGRPARWLFNTLRPIWNGNPLPRSKGKLLSGKDAPISDLGLRAGDLVRVKSFESILQTVDAVSTNRGLSFDAEMISSCGKVYKVRTRIEKFIDEKTGVMKSLKTPAVILEGAYCQSRYSDNRLFCPRSIYTWWREIWLERVPANTSD